MDEQQKKFSNFGTWTGLDQLIREMAEARDYSPMNPEQLTAWRGLTKNDPDEVQNILDNSPIYQEMLKKRGIM